MATEILNFDTMEASTGNKFEVFNRALRQIEGQTIAVESRSNGGPPVSPVEGQAFIVDSSTGDWGSFPLNSVAHYYLGTYRNYSVTEGLRLYVKDEGILLVFNGVSWVEQAATDIGLAGLTDNSVPFVSGGIVTEDVNFNYNPATDTLTVPNLTVTSNLTSIETTNLNVSDAIISLADGNATDTLDIGLVGERASDNVAFFFDESDDTFAAAFTTNDSSASTITPSTYAPLKIGKLTVTSPLGNTGELERTETSFDLQSFDSDPLRINPLGNNVTFCEAGGNVAFGTGDLVSNSRVQIRQDGSNNQEHIYLRNGTASTDLTSTIDIRVVQDINAGGRIRFGRSTSGGNSFLSFWTADAGTESEAMRLDAANRMGVNQTNPNAVLDIGAPSSGSTLIAGLQDNTANAVSMAQGGNEYFTIDTTNGSELVTIGNTTTQPNVVIPGGNVAIGSTIAPNLLSIGDNSSGAEVYLAGLTGTSNDYLLSNTTGNYLELEVPGGTQNIMTWLPTGNVGVGNPNPTRKLSIGDGLSSANAGVDSSTNPYFALSRAGSEVGFIGTTLWNTGAGSDTELSIRGASGIGFTIGTNQAMLIDASRNVGIGTSLPASKLHVSGGDLYFHDANGNSTNTGIISHNGTSGLTRLRSFSNGGNTELSFSTSLAGVESTQLLINSSGNVGIGTTTPNTIVSVLRDSATSSTASNAIATVQISNSTGSYTANNIVGSIGFTKNGTYANDHRAGIFAKYLATGSQANNVGMYLSFNTSSEAAGGGLEHVRISAPAAGETSLWLYDADNATLERVTVGAADSGGTGFKVLRIPN